MPYVPRPEQRGAANAHAILSPQQVAAAKKLLAVPGVKQTWLAQLLDVSDAAINHIASARNWQWLEIDANGDATEIDEQPEPKPLAVVPAASKPVLPPAITAQLQREHDEFEMWSRHRDFLQLDPAHSGYRQEAAEHVVRCGICQQQACEDADTFAAWGEPWSRLLLDAARDVAQKGDDSWA